MSIQFLGAPPQQEGQSNQFKKGIGTYFPASRTLVTLPGIHATQKLAFLEALNAERAQKELPALAYEDAEKLLEHSVSLFFDTDTILIRPDPNNLPLAFEADAALQELTSKKHIKFLQAPNEKVLQALKQRGECWRISALPRSRQELEKMILDAKTAIAGEAIYYHNRFTGSRFLTYENFRNLGQLPPDALASHLREIQTYLQRENSLGYPEVAFFPAGCLPPSAIASCDFARLDAAELFAAFEALAAQFCQAVPPDLRYDNLQDGKWRRAMFTALVGRRDDTSAEDILMGLSAEYFMQLEWLPGCVIEDGELLWDSIFDEPDPQRAAQVCDPRVKSFIFNFARAYGELEYVNVARVASPLASRTEINSRRGVYLAEIKPVNQPTPVVRVIRMQKWDVAVHLDAGKDLLNAMLEAAEYSDYVLDRRFACRQLGMNLPPRIRMFRLSEVYDGSNEKYRGQTIWSTYFERDYCFGIATDKLSLAKLENRAYALKLGELLGKAAAANLILGRTNRDAKVLFDDGDEVILEENGLPGEILVTDATGSFGDFASPLEQYAQAYAAPINKRWARLAAPQEFAQAYLDAFAAEISRIQAEYRKRRRGFDSLFRHYRMDPGGNLAFRWTRILQRLDAANPVALAEAIRGYVAPPATNGNSNSRH